ncbi:MAG: hypothetical protein J6K24_04385 [Tidjanibacter sp.]|nr:hypothetical protein [Tidjanibacter sp.]
MAFDFKKEYKEFYMPGARPQLVEVPEANYLAGQRLLAGYALASGIGPLGRCSVGQ